MGNITSEGCTKEDIIKIAGIACAIEAVVFAVTVAIYCLIQRKKKQPKRVSPKERVAIYRPAHLKPDDTKNGYSTADVEFESRDHQWSAKNPQHGEVNENDYDVLWKWNPRLFKASESQGVYSHLAATDSMSESADTDQYDTTRRVLSSRRARPEEELYNKMAVLDE
ncbi:uncharacterized protein LOC124265204 [Haliotis rubra]|uniref:uncharacterized protein LOC124265204 n=1 Tax=Haliotis rubra TaxID=36100 RepID=UPI001EE60151|nr:uncharacterized protein LOC124265204 [Haliotis rubra]